MDIHQETIPQAAHHLVDFRMVLEDPLLVVLHQVVLLQVVLHQVVLLQVNLMEFFHLTLDQLHPQILTILVTDIQNQIIQLEATHQDLIQLLAK